MGQVLLMRDIGRSGNIPTDSRFAGNSSQSEQHRGELDNDIINARFF